MTSWDELADQIAAAYYAATLTPAPIPDPATGRRLLRILLEPSQRSVIRCGNAPNRGHTSALATVHDNRLVLVERRGRAKFGTRLTRTWVVDIPMVRAAGLRAVLVWCPACGDGHELTLRSLERAPTSATSIRTFPAPATFNDETGFDYDGGLVEEPGWYQNVAFALAIGPLDQLWYIQAATMALLRYIRAFSPADGDERLEILSGGSKPGSHLDLVQQIVTREASTR